jgi:hypothetical protein
MTELPVTPGCSDASAAAPKTIRYRCHEKTR